MRSNSENAPLTQAPIGLETPSAEDKRFAQLQKRNRNSRKQLHRNLEPSDYAVTCWNRAFYAFRKKNLAIFLEKLELFRQVAIRETDIAQQNAGTSAMDTMQRYLKKIHQQKPQKIFNKVNKSRYGRFKKLDSFISNESVTNFMKLEDLQPDEQILTLKLTLFQTVFSHFLPRIEKHKDYQATLSDNDKVVTKNFIRSHVDISFQTRFRLTREEKKRITDNLQQVSDRLDTEWSRVCFTFFNRTLRKKREAVHALKKEVGNTIDKLNKLKDEQKSDREVRLLQMDLRDSIKKVAKGSCAKHRSIFSSLFQRGKRPTSALHLDNTSKIITHASELACVQGELKRRM